MKYCPKCKTRASGEGTTCPKCNGPLRTIGTSEPSSAEGGATPAGQDQFALQLQGLQHEVQKSRQLVRMLSVLAVVSAIVLVVLLVSLYVSHVRQFAQIDHLELKPLEEPPGAAEIKYSATSAGKVEFVRESNGSTQTLTDYASAEDSEKQTVRGFVWDSNDTAPFTIRARFRSGLRVDQRTWSFKH